jgi:hypothetical protein
MAKAFNCPHCGVYATMQWLNLPDKLDRAQCEACGKINVWVESKIVYPLHHNHLPPPHPHMPSLVYYYYNKGRLLALSDNVAANAYLRQAYNELFKLLGAKCDSIGEATAELIEKKIIPSHFYNSLKQFGLKSVSPLSLNLEHSEQSVVPLLELLNSLIKETIANASHRVNFYAKVTNEEEANRPPLIDKTFFERP